MLADMFSYNPPPAEDHTNSHVNKSAYHDMLSTLGAFDSFHDDVLKMSL